MTAPTTKTEDGRGAAPPDRSRCAHCGVEFACDPAGPCWCQAIAPKLPVPSAASGVECLCPRCLAAAHAS
jgi:hypothetical protein